MSKQERTVEKGPYEGYDELSMRGVVQLLRQQKEAAIDAVPPRYEDASRSRDAEKVALTAMAHAGMSIDAREW